MFTITLEYESKTHLPIPPLLLPLTPAILIKQIPYLQEMSFTHFQDHISPFISKEHLEFSIGSVTMKTDYPIFMYCHFEEYTTNVLCRVKAYDAIEAITRANKIKQAVIVYDSRKRQESKVDLQEIGRLDKILDMGATVKIGGREIKLIENQGEEGDKVVKWSELVMMKRKKFESANGCVYIMI